MSDFYLRLLRIFHPSCMNNISKGSGESLDSVGFDRQN